MQPGQLPPTPTGIDYLNQIAPPTPAQGFDKKTKIIMIILGLLGIIGIGFIIIMAQGTNKGPSAFDAAVQIERLNKISSKFQKKLRTSTVEQANSSLMAVTTTAKNNIATALSGKDDLTKQQKEIQAKADTTELEKKFDDAYLNAQLDATYSREMTFEMQKTIELLSYLNKKTSSKEGQAFLAQNIQNFTTLHKQFSDATTVN